ncbi:hypothetical protein [Streptomyces mexicanus]|uniref:hypothetical protein n=1 Tax=Streptomyces mexicanus TaxID=178566 RepID=UPI0036CE6913
MVSGHAKVNPRPGIATGTSSSATVSIPQWSIVFYDANDNEAAKTVLNLTATYTALQVRHRDASGVSGD